MPHHVRQQQPSADDASHDDVPGGSGDHELWFHRPLSLVAVLRRQAPHRPVHTQQISLDDLERVLLGQGVLELR